MCSPSSRKVGMWKLYQNLRPSGKQREEEETSRKWAQTMALRWDTGASSQGAANHSSVVCVDAVRCLVALGVTVRNWCAQIQIAGMDFTCDPPP